MIREQLRRRPPLWDEIVALALLPALSVVLPLLMWALL
jgi:hypothetical protein